MKLNDFQKDKLTEIASISFGSSSTSLSKVLKEKVDFEVPTLSLETVESASEAIGLADELVTEVLLKINGDLSGIMMLFFEPNVAKEFEDLVNENKDISALPELGNILAGNALGAISKFLKLNIISSVPDVATDMRRALVISSVFQLGEETNTVLMLSTTFKVPNTQLSVQVYFLFDGLATRKILEAI